MIEETKEMYTKTEEALRLVRWKNDLWMYQNEKEEAKRLQGARKWRKDEEMAWAPPRNMSKWPDWEEARSMAKRCKAGGSGREDFVPSAISVPQKPLFRCDNQCSEKTLSFWQLASVVIKEGEESYTTNLCQKESLKAKGRKTTDKMCSGDKVFRGRMWK